jgi:hypothetical protein
MSAHPSTTSVTGGAPKSGRSEGLEGFMQGFAVDVRAVSASTDSPVKPVMRLFGPGGLAVDFVRLLSNARLQAPAEYLNFKRRPCKSVSRTGRLLADFRDLSGQQKPGPVEGPYPTWAKRSLRELRSSSRRPYRPGSGNGKRCSPSSIRRQSRRYPTPRRNHQVSRAFELYPQSDFAKAYRRATG